MQKTITITYDTEETKGTFIKRCADAWEQTKGIIFLKEAKKIKDELDLNLYNKLEDKPDYKPKDFHISDMSFYLYTQNSPLHINNVFPDYYKIIRNILGIEALNTATDQEKETALRMLKTMTNNLANFVLNHYDQIKTWLNTTITKENQEQDNCIETRKLRKYIIALHQTKEPICNNPKAEKKFIEIVCNIIQRMIPTKTILITEPMSYRNLKSYKGISSNRYHKRKYVYPADLCTELYEQLYDDIKNNYNR